MLMAILLDVRRLNVSHICGCPASRASKRKKSVSSSLIAADMVPRNTGRTGVPKAIASRNHQGRLLVATEMKNVITGADRKRGCTCLHTRVLYEPSHRFLGRARTALMITESIRGLCLCGDF